MGIAQKRLGLSWLKAVVLSDREKAQLVVSGAGSGSVPEAFRRITRSGVAVEASKYSNGFKPGYGISLSDQLAGRAVYSPGGTCAYVA